MELRVPYGDTPVWCAMGETPWWGWGGICPCRLPPFRSVSIVSMSSALCPYSLSNFWKVFVLEKTRRNAEEGSRDEAVQLPCRVRRFLATDHRVSTGGDRTLRGKRTRSSFPSTLWHGSSSLLRSPISSHTFSVVSSFLLSIIAPLVEISAWQHSSSVLTFVALSLQSSLCTKVRSNLLCRVCD